MISKLRLASLRTRLLMVVLLVIGIQSAMVIVLDIRTARQEVARQQQDLGMWVVSSLAESLTNSLVVNDLATVQSTVEGLFSGRRFLQLAVYDEQGRTIVDLRGRAEAQTHIPGWFVNFMIVSTQPTRHQLLVGGVKYGVIVAVISPVAIIERAWSDVTEAIVIALVSIFTLGLLLGRLLTFGLRPLAELSEIMDRIGQGDFNARAPDRGIPEFGKIVAVINVMSGRLSELVERTREQAASELQARRLQAFHTITMSTDDCTQKIVALLEMGRQQFSMQSAALVAQEADGQFRLLGASGAGASAAALGEAGSRLCRQVLARQAALVANDRLPQAAGEDASSGAGTFIGAPVPLGEQEGVVCFLRTSSGAKINPVDVEFATLIGQWAGLALAQERSAHLLWEEKERLQVTISSIGDGVVATDPAGRITFLNPIAEELIGVSLAEAKNHSLVELCSLIHEETRQPVANPIEECLAARARVELAAKAVMVRRNGSECPIEDSAAPIFDYKGAVVGAVMVFRDVTDSRAVANHLEHMAGHDPLTGLPNRRIFESTLTRLFKGARLGSSQTHGLCIIDLDKFKAVNDTGGHAAGDELLRQVAALFNANLRGADTLARLGGDEFGMILAHVTPQQALETANRICKAVADLRFRWGGDCFQIGASIGLATITRDVASVDDLLKAADAACYDAKREGRGRVCVANEDLRLAADLQP